MFFNLSNSNTSEEIQAIERKRWPCLASHADNIQLHPKLFGRIQALWNKRDNLKLSEEQQRLLKETYESFVPRRAKLNPEQQKRIRAINEELSVLTTQFQNNLLAITKESSVVVDTKEELQGLSSAEIAAAAEGAKERGLQGKYLLVITNTTRQPVLTSLSNRSLRKRFGKPRPIEAWGEMETSTISPWCSRSPSCEPSGQSCLAMKTTPLTRSKIRWPLAPRQPSRCCVSWFLKWLPSG